MTEHFSNRLELFVSRTGLPTTVIAALALTMTPLLTIFFPLNAHAWKVIQAQGDVKIMSGAKITSAKKDDPLINRDIIITGLDGKVLIEEPGGKIYIAAKTKIQIKTSASSPDAGGEFTIDSGKIRGMIEKQTSGKEYPYRFRTLTAVMGVRGTEFFIAQDGADEKFCTLDGVIHVEIPDSPASPSQRKSFDLAKGQGLFVEKGKAEVKSTSEDDRAKWLKLTSF